MIASQNLATPAVPKEGQGWFHRDVQRKFFLISSKTPSNYPQVITRFSRVTFPSTRRSPLDPALIAECLRSLFTDLPEPERMYGLTLEKGRKESSFRFVVEHARDLVQPFSILLEPGRVPVLGVRVVL